MGKNILKATGLILIINVCVKLLGFVREMVIADGFGASSASDAYLVAYTIPYLLQSILGYAFVSAILPVLTPLWNDDQNKEKVNRLGSTLINMMAVVMLLLIVLGVLIAPTLVWLTAPSLADRTAVLAADLTRIMFPSLLFMAIGMVISGLLNSTYRFCAAAMAPGITSLGIILAVWLFADGNIYVAAWGTLIGFVGFFALQSFDLSRSGFRYRLVCDFRMPEVKRILKEIVPIMLGLSVNQLYIVINRIFASGLAEGSISALNYASKLMNLPVGLFAAAVITAVFPRLAELASCSDKRELAKTVERGLSMILLVSVPSAVGLMMLDEPIIRLLFESGSFTAESTQMTAAALLAMSPGLIFFAVSMLMTRVCYALDDVKTPLITGALSIAANILLSVLLVGLINHVALAWANSIAAAVNAVGMWYLLDRRIHFSNQHLWGNCTRTLLASVAMGLVVLLVVAVFPEPSGKMALAALVITAIAAALVVYLIMLKILRTPALDDMVAEWLRK